MTADSEIEELLNEHPGDTLVEIKEIGPLIEPQEDPFFEQLVELDFVLPLQEQTDREDKFLLPGLDNPCFIDFFGDE